MMTTLCYLDGINLDWTTKWRFLRIVIHLYLVVLVLFPPINTAGAAIGMWWEYYVNAMVFDDPANINDNDFHLN